MDTIRFRKAALETLSSPEQLDEVLQVTGAREWVALTALVLVLGTIGVWAFEGSLPAKATAQGVVVRTGGVLNVVSMGAGMVVSVDVGVGDKVRPNQVVARVAQPALMEKIRAKRVELGQARHDRDWAWQVAQDAAKLQSDAIQLQRANAEREITELEAQAGLAAEQIPVEDQLLTKGLVTRQQTIAARQRLISIQQQIAARRAQIRQYDAQRFAIQAEPQRADTERQARIRQIELELSALNQELSLAENVVSPYAGEVIERKVDPGVAIQAQAPILSVQPDVRSLEALVYVPSLNAKSVASGMDAEISPTTVRREEFGFIRGKVLYVADYPATPAALMRNFQNEALVSSLTKEGPVTEVRVQMLQDPTSASGFRWSSSRGPDVTISSGAICTVEIITRRQKPIVLIFPYMKKKLGLG